MTYAYDFQVLDFDKESMRSGYLEDYIVIGKDFFIVALENLYKDLVKSQEGFYKAIEENNDFEKFINENVFFGLISLLIEEIIEMDDEEKEIENVIFECFDEKDGRLFFHINYKKEVIENENEQ